MFQLLKVMYVAALHYRLLLVLQYIVGKFKKNLQRKTCKEGERKVLVFDYFFCFYTSGYAGGRTRTHLIEERREGIL
jgi:hypothetical protein